MSVLVKVMPRRLLVALLVATSFQACGVDAATIIDVSSVVAVPSVKRFGINIGDVNYWDSLLTKNLITSNPGFEGLNYRSIVQCATGSATRCTDSFPESAWPTGFWNGASYEFIVGATHGRTGTVASSTAPSAGAGTSYVFAESGIVPASGDSMVLRKMFAGSAEEGWYPERLNGGTISTELSDLPPGTEGKQAVRLSTLNGGTSTITAALDNYGFGAFIQFNGAYRLTFKAKGAGGANTLNVLFQRSPAIFVDRTLVLPSSWSTYTIDFTGNENGSSGTVELTFAVSGGSAVLIDEVSLVQTNVDPANPTVFRDPVINALRSFRPGIIRNLFGEFGDSLDNQIAPPFARVLPGFSTRFTTAVTGLEYGLHEFLEVCELIGAEPWIVYSATYSNQEMASFMEYLGGPATSPYGAKRAMRGHAAPWTQSFSRIHLELGNETWNPIFSGATFSDPAAYGSRGAEIYGVARSSPYYDAAKYNFVLSGQTDSELAPNMALHNASRNNDSFALGPYLALEVDRFANNDELFGSLFAEAEMVDTTPAGDMKKAYDAIQGSSRPIAMCVYEVNLHTTFGSITQERLDSFTPSLGAGLAVANHMLLMLRELAIRDQAVFSLAGFLVPREDGKSVRLWGITRDQGVTDRKRPQFLALKLINEVIGGNLVRTTQSGDNPTWNQPPMNGASLTNAHYIQSYAFTNGSSRSLIVFNLSRASALDVTFTGPNAPSDKVTLKRLTAPAITDTNENAENVVTTTQTLQGFNPAATLTLPPYSMTALQWQSRRRRAVRK